MIEMLKRKGFVEKVMEDDRNIWELEISSRYGQVYKLSYCSFRTDRVFVVENETGIIKLRSFGKANSRMDIERFINKTIDYFKEA